MLLHSALTIEADSQQDHVRTAPSSQQTVVNNRERIVEAHRKTKVSRISLTDTPKICLSTARQRRSRYANKNSTATATNTKMMTKNVTVNSSAAVKPTVASQSVSQRARGNQLPWSAKSNAPCRWLAGCPLPATGWSLDVDAACTLHRSRSLLAIPLAKPIVANRARMSSSRSPNDAKPSAVLFSTRPKRIWSISGTICLARLTIKLTSTVNDTLRSGLLANTQRR